MLTLRRLRDQFDGIARAEPLGTVLVWCALGLTTLCIAAVLVTVQWLTPSERASLLVGSLLGWVALVALGWARGTLPKWGVFGAIAITLSLAVATPSYQSKDVF